MCGWNCRGATNLLLAAAERKPDETIAITDDDIHIGDILAGMHTKIARLIPK